ncbi:Fic/DOC family protein [Dialister sp.]|jgi:cell filamentation protein|uniref:Fic/DOC family protein n=1 Tax=Dialister sp. TaxID=1955814 RepID=UPI003A5C1C64
MNDTVYCYPGTDVLKNKLGIHDIAILHEAERDITARRLMQLQNHPIAGNFDYAHLKAIHRFLFRDIYSWAGEERTVDIARTHMFCNVKFIHPMAVEIFGKLAKENFLKELARDVFIERLTWFFSEVNALHPFREGNGRTQREFFRELGNAAGHNIDYSGITESEMVQASIDSFLKNYDSMERLFYKAIKR